MKMARNRELTEEERAALAALGGREVELTDPDAPEVLNWRGAVRGALYRPVKLPVTMRLDADIVAWFKAQGDEGYQTRINAALREYVSRHRQDVS